MGKTIETNKPNASVIRDKILAVTAKFAQRTSLGIPKKFLPRIKYLLTGKMEMCILSSYDAINVNNYNVGDRVAQMVILPYPKVTFVEKEELTETDRGEGGYGSTGK